MILDIIKRNLKHFRTSGHFGTVFVTIIIIVVGLSFERCENSSVPKFKNKTMIIVDATKYGHVKKGNTYIINVPGNVIITNDPYEVEVANACLSSAGILGGNIPATEEETKVFLEAYEMYAGKKFGE